jgi:hypothetical protein
MSLGVILRTCYGFDINPRKRDTTIYASDNNNLLHQQHFGPIEEWHGGKILRLGLHTTACQPRRSI